MSESVRQCVRMESLNQCWRTRGFRMSTAVLPIFVIFLSQVLLSLAQRPAFGRCPDVKPKEDFELAKFAGDWDEVERSFYLFESSTSCTKLNFTAFPNDTLKVDVQYNVPWRGTTSTSTYAVNDVSSNPGILNMVLSSNLPAMIARLAPGSGKYIVLDTDYDDFALIYSCTDFRLLHADFIWVLGRTADISVDARTIVYSTLDKLKINRDRLLLTPNRNCNK